MLLSMTGYGRVNGNYKDKKITVELRSLNSKFTDLRFKLPQNYKELDVKLRKMIVKRLERGKIDCAITLKSEDGDSEFGLNIPLFKKYYTELSKVTAELNLKDGDWVQSILRLPNVVGAENETLEEEEVNAVLALVEECMTKFTTFRFDEGAAMEKDCRMRIDHIMKNIDELAPFEAERVEKLRKRLNQKISDYIGEENIDANRFEQEILYYLEKIDVTEEKVRLEQHCKYFLSELDKEKGQKGRKLSFIGQEMGREINTLGSKANSSEIQRIVVRMKDDLEKIKELVANIV